MVVPVILPIKVQARGETAFLFRHIAIQSLLEEDAEVPGCCCVYEGDGWMDPSMIEATAADRNCEERTFGIGADESWTHNSQFLELKT